MLLFTDLQINILLFKEVQCFKNSYFDQFYKVNHEDWIICIAKGHGYDFTLQNIVN
jgi:hypothetical protein